ncbi:MAG: OmpA family protein [Verrucomicrobiae bacterium]|nr:OmpA family protein [Verrucomicrobiae bacterium]
MKSALFTKAFTLTAVLVIALTSGCRRKPTGITPLPDGARMGASDIQYPQPGGPSDLAGFDTVGGFGDGTGVQGTDLGGLGTPVTPGTNLAMSGGPLDRSMYREDRSFFAANVVYFDFDSSVVKTSERGKVTAVADYLRSNPAASVEVEGHCDERGTEEYNRSLGERRALAVREEIALQGIDPRRVFTISYGEDRPAVQGQNEYAWSRNRRGEFVLLSPR